MQDVWGPRIGGFCGLATKQRSGERPPLPTADFEQEALLMFKWQQSSSTLIWASDVNLEKQLVVQSSVRMEPFFQWTPCENPAD